MTNTIASWFGGAKRVLFVHAHPDDETITTGGTLAALAAAGRDPALVTLTRGEQGEVRLASLQHLAGSDQLAAHREGELAQALAALGVQRHAFLGAASARTTQLPPRHYRDSGMEWADDGLAGPAADAGADSLTAAAATDVIADLMAAAITWEVDAVVSYDALGGYRHPDHVRAHQFARAVAVGLELPFWEIVADEAGASADPQLIEAHDVTPWRESKLAALDAYSTQLSVEGDDIVHVGGQRVPIDWTETFHRLN